MRFLKPTFQNHSVGSRSKRGIGGKAAGIQALMDMGAKVPQTFFVDGIEIIHHIETTLGIRPWTSVQREILEECPFDNTLSVRHEWFTILQSEPACSAIRSYLELNPVLELEENVQYIARSSMSVEDSITDSFAGCFQSIRFTSESNSIHTNHRAIAAIASVLASSIDQVAWSRLLSSEIDPYAFYPSFIVQPYIHAQTVGVWFSHLPGTLNKDYCYVEWFSGENGSTVDGEKLVLGNALSGSSAIHRKSFSNVSKNQIPNLPNQILNAIPTLLLWTKRAEKQMGYGIDIEWCIDLNGNLFALQLRPITTDEVQILRQLKDEKSVFSRDETHERFSDRMSILGWTSMQDAFEKNCESLRSQFFLSVKKASEIAISYHGIIYSRKNFFKIPSTVQFDFKLLFEKKWEILSRAVKTLLTFTKAQFKLIRTPLPMKARFSMITVTLIDCLLAKKVDSYVKSSVVKKAKLISGTENIKTRIAETNLNHYSPLVDIIHDIKHLSFDFLEFDLPIYLLKQSYLSVLLKAFKSLNQSSFEMESIFLQKISTFDGNVTKQLLSDRSTMNSKEWLKKYGHLAFSWDLQVPVLREVVESGRFSDAVNQMSMKPVSEIDSNISNSKLRISPLNEANDRELFESFYELNKETIDRLQALMRLDEEQHFDTGHIAELSRLVVFKAQSILTKTGQLEDTDDIFFLKSNELEQILIDPSITFRSRIALRKQRSKQFDQNEPWTIPFTDKDLQNTNEDQLALNQTIDHVNDQSILKGTKASPGKIQGIAYVISSSHPQEGHTPPKGSILIVKSPNPAWTLYYPMISGLVTECGGTLSHGFLTAREYGIPALSNVMGATNRIKTGMSITVDANEGFLESGTSI